MFTEPEESRAEQIAARLADVMGSWRFMVVLLILAVGYGTVIVVIHPFRTEAAILFNYLGITLTTLVAFQTPLILLTQRRDAARDRARDMEALRVATHVERDLHTIRDRLPAVDDDPGTVR